MAHFFSVRAYLRTSVSSAVQPSLPSRPSNHLQRPPTMLQDLSNTLQSPRKQPKSSEYAKCTLCADSKVLAKIQPSDVPDGGYALAPFPQHSRDPEPLVSDAKSAMRRMEDVFRVNGTYEPCCRYAVCSGRIRELGGGGAVNHRSLGSALDASVVTTATQKLYMLPMCVEQALQQLGGAHPEVLTFGQFRSHISLIG